MTNIPWDQINDLLLRAGAAQSRSDLFNTLLAGIGGIIPWDVGIGVFDRDIRCVACEGWDSRTFDSYNAHYHEKVPFILYDQGGVAYRGKDIVKWNRVSDGEFMNDFARPLKLHSGLSPFRPQWPLNISLQRSKDSPEFSPRDCAVLDIVNGHLHNYLRLFALAESGGAPGRVFNVSNPAQAIRFSLAFRYRLTPRETEVLGYLGDGLSNRSIAANMCVTERTIKAHISSLFMKMGVASRLQAVALSSRAELL